jgi:hypothetical protein
MVILPYAVGTAEVGERSAAAAGVAEGIGDQNEPPDAACVIERSARLRHDMPGAGEHGSSGGEAEGDKAVRRCPTGPVGAVEEDFEEVVGRREGLLRGEAGDLPKHEAKAEVPAIRVGADGEAGPHVFVVVVSLPEDAELEEPAWFNRSPWTKQPMAVLRQ